MAHSANRRHRAGGGESEKDAGYDARSGETERDNSVNERRTIADKGSAFQVLPVSGGRLVPMRLRRNGVSEYFTGGAKAHVKNKLRERRRSKILSVALCVAVLTSLVIVLNRQRRIDAGIRRKSLNFLANHNCPRSEGRGVALSLGRRSPTGRRLAEGGESPPGDDVDPEMEVRCLVADVLSRVEGGETVEIFYPDYYVGGAFCALVGNRLSDVIASVSRHADVHPRDVPQYLQSLLAHNPSTSVTEIPGLVLYYGGDVDKIGAVLERADSTASLERRELDRCGHRHLGFKPLLPEQQLEMARTLGIGTISRPAYMVPADQLGDPLGVIDVPADGNCFYYALSYIASGSSEHWARVRCALADWMQTNLAEGGPFEPLITTEELREHENHERSLEFGSRQGAEVPYFDTDPENMSRDQLLKARCFRVRNPILGTFARDLEIEAVANMLGFSVATFLQGAVDPVSGRRHLDLWEVRHPLGMPTADGGERPVLYMRLTRGSHFQPVAQVTPPFIRSILTSHLNIYYEEMQEDDTSL
ncbi:hypothetical protein CSUI_008299 [Cystoisospora suis]|uniref:OTU domain-containing protein n=1 Tax=Cystoisospora suis TaxID=483139 RepID=A0A2C6KN31_9APIC|nr:hypothetical protein CSUI_008299 [Cystoisospora suis]